MAGDFKETYINEEMEKEAKRRERLRKIGMVSRDADTAPSASSPNAQQVRKNAPQAQRPVQSHVQPSVQAQRPVQQQRPVQAQRPVQQEQRPSQYYTQNVRKTQVEMSPQQVAAMEETYVNDTASQPQVQRPVQQQRPVQNQARPAQPQRPVQNSQQRSAPQAQRPAQQAQRPAQQRPVQQRSVQQRPVSRSAAIEDDMFGNTMSDEASREAMFGLTGKPMTPERGRDVDPFELDMDRKRNANGFRRRVEEEPEQKSTGRTVGRVLTVFASFLLAIVVIVYAFLIVVAYGPSPVFRDQLVLMAEQASATKWAPYLVLPKSKVEEIVNASNTTIEDVISLDDYTKQNETQPDTPSDSDATPAPKEDKWAKAQDGMIFEIVNKSTFKAYVLLVKDASRVFVGTSTDDFDNATAGVDVFEAADRYGAVACINGGEFLDNGGHGSGYAPLGLTFSKGECVFNDYSTKTFMGITHDNELIVRESMTVDEAKALNIRDGVSFQTGNTLIEKKDNQIVMHYQDSNTGTSQRSCIGQAADGTMILIVTDGRTASSPGATHNDMIKLMVEYGAVSAGMLDGGSSAMMFYRDWFDKYDADKTKLDQYQQRGLVNNYKAFTNPRKIPSFFMVEPLS